MSGRDLSVTEREIRRRRGNLLLKCMIALLLLIIIALAALLVYELRFRNYQNPWAQAAAEQAAAASEKESSEDPDGGAAAVLLSAGAKGKRYCLPNSMVLIHQPSGGAQGQQTEIAIVADFMLKTRERLNRILAENTGQDIDTIQRDTERDNYMTAEEALAYGLVDKITTTHGAAAE